MDPVTPLLALWALGKSQSGSGNQRLAAYAVPSMGWLVIQLPWALDIVIGNTYAFTTNGKGYFVKRFGSDDDASKGLAQYKDFKAGALKPMPTKEPAQATWWASPRMISAKWRGFVWALDESNNIATVDNGHFLGKCLQGTQATCSAIITTILQAAPGSLEPLTSSTVGRCHPKRAAWR